MISASRSQEFREGEHAVARRTPATGSIDHGRHALLAGLDSFFGIPARGYRSGPVLRLERIAVNGAPCGHRRLLHDGGRPGPSTVTRLATTREFQRASEPERVDLARELSHRAPRTPGITDHSGDREDGCLPRAKAELFVFSLFLAPTRNCKERKYVKEDKKLRLKNQRLCCPD